MTDDHTRRIVELETELSFQADTVRALNSALVAQQRQLSELQHELRILREVTGSLRRQLGSGPDAPEEGPPPHY